MAEQPKSNRVFLLVAVVLGVLATVTMFAYLQSSTGADAGLKLKVLVAARDLPANTSLNPDKDLKPLEIPASAAELYGRCLQPAMSETYKGQRINRRILAGTFVFNADLAVPLAELELRFGRSAITIPAKGAHAGGGLIVPGDYVKVMVTRPGARERHAATSESDPMPIISGPGRYETICVTPESVRVLAVGGRLSRSRQQLTAAEQFDMSHEPETQQGVMIEVTEDQAKKILQESGAFQLPTTILLDKLRPATQPR